MASTPNVKYVNIVVAGVVKRLPVGGLIWEALGGNTRDLDSIWKETGQDYNFIRSGFKNAHIVPGDGFTIPCDGVRINKGRHQRNQDGV
ncbi:hypothetical protein Tco_0667479 [Tanacetum coccineum]